MEQETIVGGNIYCRFFGTGPTVVLLHGFGEDGKAWDEVLPYFKGPYRLLIPDIPGSGRSPIHLDRSSIPSIDALADSLMALVSKENTQNEKVILAGHSMGGYLALSIAERYPESIAGLALVHSTAYADSEEKKANRTKSMAFIQEQGSKKYLQQSIPGLFGHYFKETHPLQFQNWIDHYTAAFPVDILLHYLAAMRDRPDRTAIIKRLKVPIAFVIGAEDQAVPFQHSLEQAQMAHKPVICQMKNIGHMGMIEAPETIGPFLQQYFLDILNNG
jgi:pimeloyl-ACP methyl ester carboxylesterase